MVFKITIGEHASKAVADADLRIDGKLMQSWSPPVRNEAQLLTEVQFDKKTLDAHRLEMELKKVVVSDIEVHSSLQGTFSLSAVGTVINHFRHRGIRTALVIHRDLGDIAGKQGSTTSIRVLGDDLANLSWPNPTKYPDSFDILRQLEDAVDHLRREIRSINDPALANARVRSARAHLDSLSAFLNDDAGMSPDEVPAEVPRNLKDRLAEVNWANISTHSQKWADTIVRLIDKLFS
ncbi:hypothetical protein [uncultured Roseobacter sp.]|uniref:hypothetical protein n=1 Tax=uncultured Roseobacter sp. TaxID=114847 RepID=UPI00262BEBD7|nr:hypothetical protein [uncultured Roseobacter sp.]